MLQPLHWRMLRLFLSSCLYLHSLNMLDIFRKTHSFCNEEKKWFNSLSLATGWYNLWQNVKLITQLIIKYLPLHALNIVFIHTGKSLPAWLQGCVSPYICTAFQIDVWLNSNTPRSKSHRWSIWVVELHCSASWNCDSQCTKITICSALNEEKDGLQRSAWNSFIKRVRIHSGAHSSPLHWFKTQPCATFSKSTKSQNLFLNTHNFKSAWKGFKGLMLLTRSKQELWIKSALSDDSICEVGLIMWFNYCRCVHLENLHQLRGK